MSEPVEPKAEETVTAPELVNKEAYLKVSSDMHKFKSESKALAAKLAEFQADKEATEKARLEEAEQWHVLYKKAEDKLKAIETERISERNKFIESHKVNAVIQAVGGFKQVGYHSFIAADKIVVGEDGSIDTDSVTAEVARLRKEHPELLKATAARALPDAAPIKFDNKPISEMTAEERSEAKRRLIK